VEEREIDGAKLADFHGESASGGQIGGFYRIGSNLPNGGVGTASCGHPA